VFTPAAPIRNTELFSGRQEQMVRVVDTFHAPGEHAAIFGERGVGKTSLASVTAQMATAGGGLGLRVNCTANDVAGDIWLRVGEALNTAMHVDQAKDHALDDLVDVASGAVQLLTSQHVSTHDLLTALQIIGQVRPVVLFLDEFDRVEDRDVHAELVDLMKAISDQVLPITVVVVGVAADVDSLIEEHQSIGRGFNQVEMPRMSTPELTEIAVRGLAQAEMTAAPDAAEFIGQLSTGLPHYAHLMGLHSGLLAVREEATEVIVAHVLTSLPEAVARAQQHVSKLYFDATHSTQRNLFKQVLLAAALAPTDEHGYFAPGDLRAPMTAILQRDVQVEIPMFAKQLSAFAGARGPVLDRTGVSTRPRYRFVEPLLVPYVSMRGVNENLISPSVMRKLLSTKAPK
jgi:hypothetical protein